MVCRLSSIQEVRFPGREFFSRHMAFVSKPTAFYADLWPRGTVFRRPCVLPTSADRPQLFVSCSIQSPIGSFLSML